jgi:arylsulfatase A-like enzyme
MKIPKKLILILSFLAVAWPELQATRPNILIIFTDDIGQGDIKHYNPLNGFPTPNIDRLAREGVTFHQSHSSAALCAPSRYAFLTGNHVYRGRTTGGVWSHCQPSQILPENMTIAELLRDNGYRTAFLGKSHLGAQFYKRNSTEPARFLRDVDVSQPMFDGPKDHGFDYTLTMHSGIQHAPFAYFENDRLSRWNSETKQFDHFETEEEARKVFKHDESRGHIESELTNIWWENYRMEGFDSAQTSPILTFKTIEFIENHVREHGDQPFFVYLATEVAHSPFTPPVDLAPHDPDDYMKEGKYPIKGMTPNIRADMVYASDVITGVLMEKLKELGIYDNTIIIYTSDNGAATYWCTWTDPKYETFKWGTYGGARIDRTDRGRTGTVRNPHGLTFDGRPLRGQKGYAYDGGHRVPLIISGGSAVLERPLLQGFNSQQLLALHDVYATLCELAGIAIPEGQAVDSISFADILTGARSEDDLHRQWMHVQGMIPMTAEQYFAARIAEQRGFGVELGEHGLIKRLTGPGAPTNSRLMAQLQDDMMARMIYLQEDGKRWKLILSVNRHNLDQDIRAWELYELVTDPVEANNLIRDIEKQELIQRMIDHYLSVL